MLDISLVQERRFDLPAHTLAESIVGDLAIQRVAPAGGLQRFHPNREVNVASEQGRTGNMMVQKSQPLTRPPVDPNNKNKNLLLSREAWLFNRDPYNGLL